VAVDLSAESQKILDAAIDLFQDKAEILHIVHGIEPVSMAYVHEAQVHAIPDLQAQLESIAERKLVDLGATVDVPHKILRVLQGSPSTSICEYAANINADLIVLGSHGRAGWRVILGSTANSVVQRAGCDVLTIRVDKPEASE
jgi:universal stress protein A